MISGNLPTLKSSSPALTLTWRGIEYIVHNLHKVMVASGEGGFPLVVGISRGGVIPAALLARKLHIPLIKTLHIKSYDDLTNRQLPKIECNWPEQEIEPLQGLSRILVVDDIADTGATMSFISEVLPQATRVALVTKPQGIKAVQYSGQHLEVAEWVIFPWESKSGF